MTAKLDDNRLQKQLHECSGEACQVMARLAALPVHAARPHWIRSASVVAVVTGGVQLANTRCACPLHLFSRYQLEAIWISRLHNMLTTAQPVPATSPGLKANTAKVRLLGGPRPMPHWLMKQHCCLVEVLTWLCLKVCLLSSSSSSRTTSTINAVTSSARGPGCWLCYCCCCPSAWSAFRLTAVGGARPPLVLPL